MGYTPVQSAVETRRLQRELEIVTEQRDFLLERTNELGRDIGDLLERVELLEIQMQKFTFV